MHLRTSSLSASLLAAHVLPAFLLLGLTAYLSGCVIQPTAGNRATGGARVEGEAATAAVPAAPARRVYVQDFALDVDATEPPRTGLLGRPRLFQELTGENPQAHARRVVDEMASSLVKDLNAARVAAERLATGAPLPPDGWLIRGVFTEADSGKVLRRAVIGFGSGKTDMEVQVGVSDLAVQPNESFLVFGTVTDPSRLPGGVVTRNPYVVVAKFVLEKGAPERDVQHTAKAIADELVKFREQVRSGQVKLPATR